MNNLKSLQTGKNEVIFGMTYTAITQDVADQLIAENISLIAFTIDDKNAILNLNPYVSGIMSNLLIAGEVLEESERK